MSQQGSPGRYQRSFPGLVVAMAVTVVAVLAYAGVQSLAQEAPTARPRPVDYREHVRALQDQGVRVPYPASLPSGWIVRKVDYRPSSHGTWSLSLLTADNDYLGVVLQRGSVASVVRRWMGDEVTQGERVRIPRAPVTRWRSFSDPGGDIGYVPVPGAREGQRTLLVYGNAPAAEVRELASRLTTAPLE